MPSPTRTRTTSDLPSASASPQALDDLRAAREAVFTAWATPECNPRVLPPCRVCGDDPLLRASVCHLATCPPPGAPWGVRERHNQLHLRQGRLATCQCGHSPRLDRDAALRAVLAAAHRAYATALGTGMADDWTRILGVPRPDKFLPSQPLSDLLPGQRG